MSQFLMISLSVYTHARARSCAHAHSTCMQAHYWFCFSEIVTKIDILPCKLFLLISLFSFIGMTEAYYWAYFLPNPLINHQSQNPSFSLIDVLTFCFLTLIYSLTSFSALTCRELYSPGYLASCLLSRVSQQRRQVRGEAMAFSSSCFRSVGSVSSTSQSCSMAPLSLKQFLHPSRLPLFPAYEKQFQILDSSNTLLPIVVPILRMVTAALCSFLICLTVPFYFSAFISSVQPVLCIKFPLFKVLRVVYFSE